MTGRDKVKMVFNDLKKTSWKPFRMGGYTSSYTNAVIERAKSSGITVLGYDNKMGRTIRIDKKKVSPRLYLAIAILDLDVQTPNKVKEIIKELKKNNKKYYYKR
jgi:hypothetical protein